MFGSYRTGVAKLCSLSRLAGHAWVGLLFPQKGEQEHHGHEHTHSHEQLSNLRGGGSSHRMNQSQRKPHGESPRSGTKVPEASPSRSRRGKPGLGHWSVLPRRPLRVPGQIPRELQGPRSDKPLKIPSLLCLRPPLHKSWGKLSCWSGRCTANIYLPGTQVP